MQGTTSLTALFALNPRPNVFSVTTWTDCLVMLQQGQVDAISTDDVVLFGLAAQDGTWRWSDPASASSPGVGIGGGSDLVRFVNGALDEMRVDPERGNASTRPGCEASDRRRAADGTV